MFTVCFVTPLVIFHSVLCDAIVHIYSVYCDAIIHVYSVLCDAIVVVYSVLCDAPQWVAADAEVKVPSGENTDLKRSPFNASSRSEYSPYMLR